MTDPSPAERFAAAAARRAFPLTAQFAGELPFELDPFQFDACQAVERGDNVLVCAPTGAGKTVVGEFAAVVALDRGASCLYTTPIKALSNQKYRDFTARYGADRVGLITGDTSINPHAPIVVMTTEVLRNMLYASAPDLARVSSVVLDEIHYLADRSRGAVWEEVIIHLPERISVIGLSATVSNAEEFGDWITAVRGHTTVIVDETRPVPLWQHLMVGSRLYDLYLEEAGGGDRARRVNPEITRAIRQITDELPRRGSGHRRYGGWRPPPRPLVIERLNRAGLLPAIVFIFSRVGCDAAVDQCLRAEVHLTTPAERAAIDEIVDRSIPDLSAADLDVLGFDRWRGAWARGIAAHHAGLLPAFKQIVEELFVRGLVKVVFATETLALGINMPARSVVLERLVKFDGDSHADLTPGEYTQLTGRAGRRGIDIEGHAVVIWNLGVDPTMVAGLAGARTFPLRSSFRPTYNMVVNLVDRQGLAGARHLLELSFAQFQLNRVLVGVTRQVDRNSERAEELRLRGRCERGDATEYAGLCRQLSVAEKDLKRTRTARRRDTVTADLEALRRGDIIAIPVGRRRGLAVVLDGRRRDSEAVRPLVATDRKWAGRVDSRDFTGPIEVLGQLRLPKYVEHWKPAVRRDLASSLAASGVRMPAATRHRAGGADPHIDSIRRALRAHPVHHCPDRERHLAAIRVLDRLTTDTAALTRQIDGDRDSMAATLDRLHGLLTARGLMVGEKATASGRVLQRVWSETDLLAVECLGQGLWRDLDGPHLAGAVSGLVFEARGGLTTPAGHLTGVLRAVGRDMELLRRELASAERQHGLPATRELDFGFASSVATWARGEHLATALAVFGSDVDTPSAGDFVRWCRQVIDLLDQLRSAARPDDIPAVDAAIAGVRRGLVTWGTE